MAGLDHAVIVARDLGALSAEFEALGFLLTPTAQHPWGTANRLAQFEGRNFLELLTIDRPELVAREPATVPDGPFSFGRHAARFLAEREGFAMLALQTADSAADLLRWRAAGLVTYEPFRFERQAALPDGSVATVAFSLAFTTHPLLPDLVFFTCLQHAPEHFWKPAYQSHPNGATELVEVSIAVREPHRLASFLAGLTGSECRARGDGIECDVGPHRIVFTPSSADASRDGVTLSIRVPHESPLRGRRSRAGGVILHGV